MSRAAFLAAMLPVTLLIGSVAAPYGPAWWAAALGFTAAAAGLAVSIRVEPAPAGTEGGDGS